MFKLCQNISRSSLDIAEPSMVPMVGIQRTGCPRRHWWCLHNFFKHPPHHPSSNHSPTQIIQNAKSISSNPQYPTVSHSTPQSPSHHRPPSPQTAPSWATCPGVPPWAPAPRRVPALRRTAGGRRPSPRWGRTSAPWRARTTRTTRATLTQGGG